MFNSLTVRLNAAIFLSFMLLALASSAWTYRVDRQTLETQFVGVASSVAPTMIEVVMLDQAEAGIEFNRRLRNFPHLNGVTLFSLDGERRYEYRRQPGVAACSQQQSWLSPLLNGCMYISQQLEYESSSWLRYTMEVDTEDLQWQIARQVSMTLLFSLLAFAAIYRIIGRWLSRPMAELVSQLPAMGSGAVSFPRTGRQKNELAELARVLEQSDRALHEKQIQAEDLNTRLSQSLQAKSDFLANASHEIRTPLNAVIGFVDCLGAQRSRLNPEGQQQLLLLQGASQSLLHIVNDVLDFSRLESGKLSLDPQPSVLVDFLQRVHAHFQGSARLQKVLLGLDLADDLPLCVSMDEGRMEQILGNLLSNAIKFSPSGQVQLSAEVLARDDTQCTLVVAVTDTGIGIDSENLPYIFDAYTQADGSVTRRFGGTGLGLAICKRLSLLMEGELQVQSEMGKGSRFTLTLTVPLLQQVPGGRIETEENANPLPLKGLSILLAEDNLSNQKLMQIMLKKLGCEQLQIAANGQQAVDASQQQQFDLILMDCQMPLMDGYRATRQIRLGPGAGTLIVALTANATAEDKQRCLDCGMDGFLTKPVTLATLARGIAEARAATSTSTV
ncbi:Signal transduction histidine kinase [Ferrimonas sediminum]|uniref:histidine kinase n=1 Tax=Ferrimonas sediminum TaxID=718193 RepID=A0A1G8N874_9GAMM|nr:ATP-binding protein [Ferrimonas sediminum]SDI75760.1 Signal transduction histidine kinase [Ferrimonas sediminum]